jgi:hypothetical protein
MNYRPLSPVEHSLELLNQCANTWNIVTVSRIRGKLTPALLRQALDTAQAKHPMLKLCIVGSLEKPEFQSCDRAIPLSTVTKTHLAEWSDVATVELNHKLETDLGLMRVVLVSFTQHPEHHYLITTMHHAIADGQATVQFHAEVLEYCAQLAAGETPDLAEISSFPVVDQLLPNPPSSGLWGFIRAIAYPLLLGLKWLWFRVKSLAIATNVPISERGCRLIPHQLTPEQTQQFIQCCRDRNLTVQSGLCAALLLSISRQIPENPDQAFTVSCDSAIDLRRRLNPPISPSVLFSGATWVRTYHRVEPGIDFWDFATQIDPKLSRAIARGDMFKVAISALAMSATVIKQPNAVHTTGFISNLGRLRVPDRYGEFELEHVSFMAANALFAAVPALYVSTFADRMQLNFMFSDPALEATTMRKVVDQVLWLIDEQSGAVMMSASSKSVTNA